MQKRGNKGNPYATNKGGIIRAPKPVTDQPKATVAKGSDLRNGKKSKQAKGGTHKWLAKLTKRIYRF